MAIYKEVPRNDGSGISEYYRIIDGKAVNMNYNDATNKPSINGFELVGNLNITDLGFEGAIESKTGKEMSEMTTKDTKIVLCTSDYTYRDNTDTLTEVKRGVVYEVVKGRVVDSILVSGTGEGGGGGSGNPRSNYTVTISPLEQNVAVGAKTELKFYYETTAMPNVGTAQLYVNGKLKSNKSVTKGEYSFDITQYVVSGSNVFQIITTDRNEAKITLDYVVNGIELVLSSSFNDSVVKDTTIDVGYKLVGYGKKVLHFIIDDEETTMEINANKLDAVKTFKNLSHGAHILMMYADTDMDGVTVTSNILEYNFLCADPTNDEILVTSAFNQTEATQGDTLLIDYMVYSNASQTVETLLQINGETKLTVNAGRTKQYWNISSYPAGTVTFSIVVGDIVIDHVVEVAELDMDLEPVTDNMSLYLTANGRSNQEQENTRTNWSYGDVTVNFNNMTWKTDGWIDGALKLKGKANAVIPMPLFGDDIRKTGKTIEVEFETFNAFSPNSSLVECYSDNKGFKVKQNSCEIVTEQTSVVAKYNESSRVRISFVIESTTANSLIRTYIDGVLSGLTQYVSTDNLQQTDAVGITLNPDEEEINIYCIRVYDRALSSEEILNNYIYDISDNARKIAEYTSNQIYDASTGEVSYTKLKSTMPVLTVIGEMPPAKGEKRTVQCIYENTADPTYNFTYEGCTIDVQGTSSQYYPRKNWKIKLPEKIKFHENAIEENTFCFKADYMDTSHSHNIGSAIIANGLPTDLFPTRKTNPNVRDTMYGFPCVIFHKNTADDTPEFYGTYMFNNDKSDSDTLGLTTEKSESWEFCNNTSDHCLFKTNDFSPESGVGDNLEARYPDKNTDYTAIKKLYDWVVECNTTNNLTKFKNEFAQHLNLDYCLNYTVFMEFAMLTDSRAKNMFLDTTDGEIWYPRFYDMDTAWGLNNEGVLKFTYDVEIHDQWGSGWVWNDQGESVLWNLFEQAFSDEIKERYHLLRKNKLTYEAMMETYIENISDKFVEASYNEDSQFKYVDPLVFDNDSTYLYAAQGSRKDHFKYILTNRITYLDSKYEYGDYNSNYATMRLYAPKADFSITPYTTEYINIKFGSTIKGARCPAEQTTQITSPEGLIFNDTETIIYGASEIASFGDLSDKYPGTVDITRCGKLQDLIIGSSNITNTNLTNIAIGNNPLLRVINVTNCVNLTGALDASGCTDLREVYAKGSGITSITLPETSTITKLHLPKSITSLTLRNQNALTDLQIETYENVSTIDIANSGIGLDLVKLLAICPNLSRARVEFNNDVMSMDLLKKFTDDLKGIDNEGFNTEHATFTGTLRVEVFPHLSAEMIAEYKADFAAAYPDLKITYIERSALFTFQKYSGATEQRYAFLYEVLETSGSESPVACVPKLIKNSTVGIEAGNPTTPVEGIYNYNGYQISNDLIEVLIIPDQCQSTSSEYLDLTGWAKLEYLIYKWPARVAEITSCPKLKYIGDISKVYGLYGMSGLSSTLNNTLTMPPSVTNIGYSGTVDWNYFKELNLEQFTNLSYTWGSNSYYPMRSISWSTYSYDTVPDTYRPTGYPVRMNEEALTKYNNMCDKQINSATGYNGPYGMKGFKTDVVDMRGARIPWATNYAYADEFLGLDEWTGEYYSPSYDAYFGIGTVGPLFSGTLTEVTLSGVVNLTHANGIIVPGQIDIRLPNLKKLYVGAIKMDTYFGGSGSFTSLLDWKKGQIIFPTGVKLYSDYDDVDQTPSPTRCSLVTFLRNLYWQKELPAFDCSAITYGGSFASNGPTYSLQKCGGFQNYGKAFDNANGANYANYTLDLNKNCNIGRQLDHDSLVNILKGLYNLSGNGKPAQKIILGSQALAKLTATEKAIATNKGWTLS